MLRWVALLAIAGLTGCGSDAREDWPPTDDTSAAEGTNVDWAAGRLTAAVQPLVPTTEGLDAQPLLARVCGLAMNADGHVVATDYVSNMIVVLFPGDDRLVAVGRAGQGPGELLGPCSVGFAPDGRAWIQELGNSRYSIFAMDGDSAWFEEAVRPAVPVNRMTSDRVAWTSREELINVSTPGGPRGLEERTLVQAFVDETGRVTSERSLPLPPPDSLAEVSVSSGTGTTVFRVPFGPVALWAFGHGGEHARGVSSQYAVDWFNGDGSLRCRVERSVVSPRLTEEERRRAETVLGAIRQRPGVRPSSLPRELPRTKQPLASLGFDLDGRLWVERSVALGESREADVYSDDCEPVATMSWPSTVRLIGWVVRGRNGVGVETDRLGVERLVKLNFGEELDIR